MNPDGASSTSGSGHFHFWRKNRQPTPGSSRSAPTSTATRATTGACGGGTSGNPEAITYRGAKRVLRARDPGAARLPRLPRRRRAAADPRRDHFHEAGRLVMWPYGYTKKNVAGRHDRQDHAALATIGRHGRRRTATSPSRAATCTSPTGRRATGCTATTGSSRTRSRCRTATIPGRRSSGPRPAATARPSCTWPSGLVPAVRPRAGRPRGALRGVRRRPRGRPRLDRQPRRHRHRARARAAGPAATRRATTSGGVPLQPTTATSGRCPRDRAARRVIGRADDLDGLTTIQSVPITLPAAAGQR